MRKRDFHIVFASLKPGLHTFEYDIDDTFLDILFDYKELPGLKAHVVLEMLKQNTLLELSFRMEGSVPLTCDLSNEPFEQKLKNSFSQVVKFGEAYNDDDDELLILPHSEYQIDISQQLYELLVLSVPPRRIHPDILSGKMHPEILDLLEQYTPEVPDDTEQPEEESDERKTDPRWLKLKDLLN